MRIAGLVLLFFFLARPVLNPTGLERWLGSGGRSSQVVRGRRLDEHGLRGGRCLGVPARPGDGRRDPGRRAAAGPLHDRDDLVAADARCCTRSRARAATS